MRVSRAGHTFHERWAARQTLQLVFPKDNLFAIAVEGLSSTEKINLGSEAECIADLILIYGEGDNFETCSFQQILQLKYKEANKPVTSSYLRKTIKKFAATLRNYKANATKQELEKKLSFGFVTNAEFSDNLWQAIRFLKSGEPASTKGAIRQIQYLQTWCEDEQIKADDIFKLIEFQAGTSDLPTQNRLLLRTISDWSANSTGQAAQRLLALVELVREKSQLEGQENNLIRREDILNALGCDEDQLFPADTSFIDVDEIVDRHALDDVKEKVIACERPVFLHADGGVGKTVFVQSFAKHLTGLLEVVVFDCFGGGVYRSEAQARHSPGIGLLQIVNELASRGRCDPLLPTDSGQCGLIKFARKHLAQACKTVRSQSSLQGVLIIIDAADNAQMEADTRREESFPRLLLASLGSEPIDGVKLMLTARTHRMDSVIGNSQAERVELKAFSRSEAEEFLATRREKITSSEFAIAFSRSRGNARVLEYLVQSWDINVSSNAPPKKILVEDMILQKCDDVSQRLHTAGWNDSEICEFFAALSLLPPPIPLVELAAALGWPEPQVNSAASDLAPMLEQVKHGVIFRDEPTETYIKEHYACKSEAQQSIAKRLQERQKDSIYAAEALPHFLVVIGDSERAYQLSSSDVFPADIKTDFERRILKLSRLRAAFSLATSGENLDHVLKLTVQLAQVSSANERGDEFIRLSPSLAMLLGKMDASRRFFNDRAGSRGARDARLTVAYCFKEDYDEARIHQRKAIDWINWHLHNDDETTWFQRSGFEEFDIAAVLLLSVLNNEMSSLDRNIQLRDFRFALLVCEQLVALCAQHQTGRRSSALTALVNFAASKRCSSLALQLGLLKQECGLTADQQRAISRAASVLAHKYRKKIPEYSFGGEEELQGAISSAALTSLIINSRQSAKRLLGLFQRRRPSSYDYIVQYGPSRVWKPVQSACLAAWSSDQQLSYHHLIPEDVKIGRKAKSIDSDAELRVYLNGLTASKTHDRGRKLKEPETREQYSTLEQNEIVSTVSCILNLVKPLEDCILAKKPISNDVLAEFLAIWKSTLRPLVHWRSETGVGNVARHVGIGLAKTQIRHCEMVETKEAEELIEIIESNQFSMSDKLSVLALLARRTNLADIVGSYAGKVSDQILEDESIERRGESYRELAVSLLSLSIDEAKTYYARGLAQVDQMDGGDSDLIYSVMHFAEKQPGGFAKPSLSHRLMGLCQANFQPEPHKFGWTLFGRAASSSIGFPALYKLIRWNDQGVADYPNGLPQLACYLAKAGHLDPRRAAIMLTLCKEQGWRDWQVGHGLKDLLLVASAEARKSIFTVVAEKLGREHSFGGRASLWQSLLDCMDACDEIKDDEQRSRYIALRDAARRRNDIENAKRNNDSPTAADYGIQERTKTQNDTAQEETISAIYADCDLTSVASLDEALHHARSTEGRPHESKNRLFQKIIGACPYGNRLEFLNALCKTSELGFDDTIELIIKCVDAWEATSAHIRDAIIDLIKTLFASKGSKLFDLHYSGISRQIHRLSKLCSDPEFVLRIVLETIAKERLDLSGDGWLQVATSLSGFTEPTTALDALEDFLSGSAANVGDETGEGEYRPEFAGKNDEINVIADLIWHLLGDKNDFVRWNAARSIKAMVEVGLVKDIGRLLDRFDVAENASLASDYHHFAYMNAQQWLLMGLARAAAHHGALLRPLKSRLIALAQGNKLHAINKLHLARCIQHIEGDDRESSDLSRIWNEVQIPAHGIVERTGCPKHEDRKIKFGFGYDFSKCEIPSMARLFGISDGKASDAIAKVIVKRWPNINNIPELPYDLRPRGDKKLETYREHIQRHALLHTATTLMQTMPVTRESYDPEEYNPWREFLKDRDVSFEDGSWLSDHKDPVPNQALELLLDNHSGNQETLLDMESLLQKMGFRDVFESPFLPIYGHWKSPDGVFVSLSSALIEERGAVGQCAKFSKAPKDILWLPNFGSDGDLDRNLMIEQRMMNMPFAPLICVPESRHTGIDEYDEYAAREVTARVKLGRTLTTPLKLKPNEDGREWHSDKGVLVLKSEAWGGWMTDPDNHWGWYQNEGVALWAEKNWLNEALTTWKRSVVFQLRFRKYRSSGSYDESSGVKAIYVGLKRSGKDSRFWFAKKASQIVN